MPRVNWLNGGCEFGTAKLIPNRELPFSDRARPGPQHGPRSAPRTRVRSAAQRSAIGRALRDRLPRRAQGDWSLATRDDLVERLEASVAGRRADLLPIRWGRMARSPFDFFRGAAALMAGDLGPRPSAGVEVQVCGDAHLLNLGAYAAPGGRLVFDLNDFDESCRGPFEWDLKRLAASVVVGGRVAGHRDRDCAGAVRSLVRTYREQLEQCTRMTILERARHEIARRSTGRPLAPIFSEAERDTPQELIAKATAPRPGGMARFRSAPPVQTRLTERETLSLRRALAAYRASLAPAPQQLLDAYRPHDFAFRVVGTGSVGLEVHLILLYGDGAADPLFLQVKQEGPSCWRPYLRDPGGYLETYPHQGRRAAEGQLRTQPEVDPLLGWTTVDGKDALVRQWSDHKASVSVKMLRKSAVLEDYAILCGRILARAHARTGDAATLVGYCGSSERLDVVIAGFALAYGDQTEADHARLCRAIKKGRITAWLGV